MGRLAMHVEGGVVLVHLVEDEEIGILCRAMRAIDETARLRLSDDPRLLGEQRGQGIALAFCRADLRHLGRAASPARARYDPASPSARMRGRMLVDHGDASVVEEQAMRIMATSRRV